MIAEKKVVFGFFSQILKDAAKNARLVDNILANIRSWDLLGGRAMMDCYRQDKVLLSLAEELAKVRYEGPGLILLIDS